MPEILNISIYRYVAMATSVSDMFPKHFRNQEMLVQVLCQPP